MAKARVVILSGYTLFAEGVVNRLRQFPQRIEVSIINPDEGEVIARIREIHPSAVIIDASEPETEESFSPWELMTSSREVKLIRLDPESSEVQIVSTKCFNASDVRDLVDLIESGG
jgi:DNA-binding NarL/FixJ family response regulator